MTLEDEGYYAEARATALRSIQEGEKSGMPDKYVIDLTEAIHPILDDLRDRADHRNAAVESLQAALDKAERDAGIANNAVDLAIAMGVDERPWEYVLDGWKIRWAELQASGRADVEIALAWTAIVKAKERAE